MDKHERGTCRTGQEPALHATVGEKELIAMNSHFSPSHAKNEPYDYYSLDMSDYIPTDTGVGYTLLAEDHEIVVAPQSGQVTLVNWERRRFVTDCLFTAQECAVFLLLLEAWPTYAPIESLLDALPRQADPAQHEPSAHAVSLSRLRALLAHCQERLHALGLDVIPVGELGVLLIHFQESAEREEQAAPHEDQYDPSACPATCEEND
jgi:hypothetical protein